MGKNSNCMNDCYNNKLHYDMKLKITEMFVFVFVHSLTKLTYCGNSRKIQFNSLIKVVFSHGIYMGFTKFYLFDDSNCVRSLSY